MKAQEWLQRADKVEDPFNKFSNGWRAFNNLFTAHGTGSELSKIQTFIANRIDEKKADSLLKEFSKQTKVLLDRPVIDMRGNGKNTKSHIIAFGSEKDAVKKIQSLFGVIYQVRCNLEHGQKSPTRKRDNDLCTASLPFILEIVRYAA